MHARTHAPLALALSAAALCGPSATAAPTGPPIDLIDADLSHWEVFLGVPHSTVEGLPEGTFQSDNVRAGEPLGLNPELPGKQTFSVIEEGGQPILAIDGEIYGGLTTLEEFESYHLTTEFRWGEKKYEPRLEDKRDSGILYHAHGEHGAFWSVWKACLEFQVQETDLGDFIPLAGPRGEVRGELIQPRGARYDPESDELVPAERYCQAAVEPDAPHGEWNTLELFVVGNNAIHVVNGEVAFVLQNAVDKAGEPLTKGQIQIQSEAADCQYRAMRLTPIDAFPAEYADLVRPAGD